MNTRVHTQVPQSARYEVGPPLGSGAWSIVYRARDRMNGEEVALKVLRGVDAHARLRIKDEFRVLCDLVHPNVARLYELVEGDDGSILFAMELVRGTDFTSALGVNQGGLADGGDALRDALRQLAGGLGALHAARKVHRDVKPSNVMVEPDGRVVILDFGGMCRIEEPASHGGPVAATGTFAYRAPEQLAGEAKPACDWFSVGVLLYETLTGQLPFGECGASPRDRRRNLPHPSSLVPEAPRDLGDLALALLLPDPGTRAGEAEIRSVVGRQPGGPLTFQEATRLFQRDLLVHTLEDTRWNVAEAARRLGLARSHVYNLIALHELKRRR